MTTLLRAGLVLALTGALAGGAAVAERSLFPRGRILPGLKVGGATVPDDVAASNDDVLRAWIESREAPFLERSVTVHVPGKELSRTVPLKSLVAPLDATTIVRRLRELGHEDELSERFDTALRARRGEIDLPLGIAVDVAAIEKIVAELKEGVDEPPTDAKLDLAAHTTFPDVPGHYLDFDGGVVTVASFIESRWLDDAATTIDVAPLTVSARVTAESLRKLDITTVVASFETHFGRGGDQAPRATNIENAAKKLDGLVLEPQQLISFNGVVGERSEANGFKMAWEIFKGEMRPGVGGGTCQVASTFHAAAFFGGLDVLERLPHSRPSAYIPMGLDSTVVYPAVDLKVKNPYSFPLVVHTIVTGNTLRVELLGKEKPVSVAFDRDTVAVLPYERRLDEESFVKPGKAIKKQGGIRGYRIKRVRTITPLTLAGGTVGEPRIEETFDFYPPTTEIYVVAPGTDPTELPTMPQDVIEALAKKKGEVPEYATAAIACAGECGSGSTGDEEPKAKVEVQNGAGVHALTGDQVAPMPKVIIKQ